MNWKEYLNFTNFLAFAILLAGGWLVWVFIQSLLDADPGIAAAIIGVVGAAVLGIWSHHLTKSREINSRHFIEKRDAYLQLIDLIYDMIKSVKSKKPIPDDEMIERMLAFKKDLLIWGSQDVIQALQNYEDFSSSPPDQLAILLAVDDLLRAIRKDLGHNDNNLKRGELVLLQVVAEDREKLFTGIQETAAVRKETSED